MASDLAQAIGWVGTALTMLWFSSPATTFRGIVRNKSVGTFDSMPYLMTFLQCSLWISYTAVTPDRLIVLVTNLLGASLELLWCVLYLRYTPRKRHMALRLFVVCGVWLAVTLLDMEFMDQVHMKPLKEGESLRTEAMGIACVLANVLSYAAPLGVFRQVVRTKSVESMPLGLSVAATCSSVCWCVYAILMHDLWVLIPNIGGVVLGVIQLGLYACYCGGSPSTGPCSADGAARSLEGGTRLLT